MSAIDTGDAFPADDTGTRHCGSHQGPRWYCVRTHIGREYEATGRLLAQGFDPYLPLKVTYAADPQDPYGRIVPLFPRYMFVRFDLHRDRWRPIASTRGVERIFCAAEDRPTAVPDRLIAEIRSRGRAGDGAIDFRQPAFSPIEPGEEVRITSGPFVDYDAICTSASKDRVRLLLDLLGAMREVEVRRHQVESKSPRSA